MRKIIVPTDFSTNAICSGKLAVAIANQLDLSLEFIHAFQSLKTGFQNDEQIHQSYLEAHEAAQIEMNRFLKEIEVGVSVPYTVVLGDQNLMDLLKPYESDPNVALVVTGTQGASGIKYRLLGSNSFDIAKGLHLPLLIVPYHAQVEISSNLSLTLFTDFHELDIQSILGAQEAFGQAIKNCRVVHLHGSELFTKKENELRLENLIFDLKKEIPNVHFEGIIEELPETNAGVESILSGYANDFVVLTMADRNFWELLMDKSLAKKIILNPTNPIFINNRSQNLDTVL